MRVLLVEDDQFKRKNIEELIESSFDSYQITHAASVSSAMRAVRDEDYDFVLLDMSLPSFDIGPTETGGRPRGFGGMDILRYLDSKEVPTTVIVVTQFERFGEGESERDLDALTGELSENFPELVRGVVYFDTSGSAWRKQLIDLIK